MTSSRYERAFLFKSRQEMQEPEGDVSDIFKGTVNQR